MVGVPLGGSLNIQVKFDALVQALLEYWDRNYSDAGNLVQKPKVPEVPATRIPGGLFDRKKRRKHIKRS